MKPRDYSAGFWIRSYITLSLHGVTHTCVLLHCGKEEARRAALPRMNGYSSVSYYGGTWYVQQGSHGWWNSDQVRCKIHLVPTSCGRKGAIALTYGATFAVLKKLVWVSGEKGAEQNIVGSSGNREVDKSDKEESKNECSAARSTNSTEALSCKITAAIISQD